MLCALIMAGGKGTRFWPLSTEEKPKQFLNLLGESTMIQMTINRIKPIIPLERIFISTGRDYVELVREQLPELPFENIIVEPQARNTAPCIALSSVIISKRYKDATMVVLASDHLIKNEEAFRNTLILSNEFLKGNKDSIITLGIEPNRAETQYGYIKVNKDSENSIIKKVQAFVEKPDEKKAREYIESNEYLWNSGMFIWKANCIIERFSDYLPNTYNALIGIKEINDSELDTYLEENYKKADAISIDYGIMEKDNNIYVIPCNFGWDDVGSWRAVERFAEKDENQNIYIGDVRGLNVEDNIVITSNTEAIISNVKGLYVIESQGKIFIGKKEDLNEIGTLKTDISNIKKG